MGFFADLKMYSRFALSLPGFLRKTVSLDEARAIIERGLARREASFLRLVERGVFGYRESPYLPLLKLAGCEMGDIETLVRSEGLEGTLRALREAGVYISFEEFKGRKPVERNGQIISLGPHAFDNPFLGPHYTAETGGSTGAGTRVETDLAHLAAQSHHIMITRAMHEVLDVPTAIWRGVLPDGSGINNLLRSAHIGRVPDRWFTPVRYGDVKPSLKYRLATQGTVRLGRLCGVPLPWPEHVGIDRADLIARWAVEMVRERGACLIIAPVSRALRVAVRAREESLDMTGATFMIAGEPPTPAKVREIMRSGARYFTTYGLAESGRIGMGCRNPVSTNDLHLMKDAFAIIQHPRKVPGWDIEVGAFNVTSLLPSAPKLMLNVEVDDYGIRERRACGCALEALGFDEHLREIHSFRKLTGEGVTLVGSEIVHILEAVLPARFGGTALDYQLMEEEDEQGFTKLSLIVSPSVRLDDEEAVIRVVLDAMSKESVGADSARSILSQARSLRVRRMEPVLTARGKLMPLYLSRRPAPTEQ
ncbi:MAG: hypothetical protein L0229_08500 [Blastocatellia bacterium]|nr:hypothetical protein [Blastocatellia bacterium]